MVWCHGHGHHAVKGEVQKREEGEEQIPEEFLSSPIEANHRIHDNTVDSSLRKNVRELNNNLSHRKIKKKKICLRSISVNYNICNT